MYKLTVEKSNDTSVRTLCSVFIKTVLINPSDIKGNMPSTHPRKEAIPK